MRVNSRNPDGSPKPLLNVMVTVNGVNEDGKMITDVHQLVFTGETPESDMLAWIEKAKADKPVDDGPPIRFESPVKKF